MSKRINVILPDSTVAVLNRITTAGNRSRFVDRAVRHLVEHEGKRNLRRRLKEGYLADAEQSLALATEWFPLEEEAWNALEDPQARDKAPKKSGSKRP